MEISSLCRVRMHYTLSLDSGEILETTKTGEPLEFIYGANEIIPGLERELAGMKEGDEKHIVVNPEDAYGLRNPDAIIQIPLEEFPVKENLEPGMIFRLNREDGTVIYATVMEIAGNDIMLDLNHPLAGETLHFDVIIDKITALEDLDDI